MTNMQESIAELQARVPELAVREHVSLTPYTTLMAGGAARWLAEVREIDTLANAAGASQEMDLPHMTIGSGSNLLASDKGYDGLVLVNLCRRMYFGKTQYAECGCWFQDVFLSAAQKGLTGLEFAVGIPGTLGGALVSNAGAYRANIADCVSEVELVRDGKRRWTEPSELEFRYRDSILRRQNPLPITLLSVKTRLEKGEPKHIFDQARDYQRQRISKQPPHPSAGSFFKNVLSNDIAAKLSELPEKLREAGIVPSGFLVEACGLKGFRVGGAMITHRHANFICNVGGASASDIRAVAKHVRSDVLEKFGVTLEEEVLYVGNWDDQE